VARAEAAGAFEEVRPGKKTALLSGDVERSHCKERRTLRLVVSVTRRTIDKKGQFLLEPEI
jgi:hypothetical protein